MRARVTGIVRGGFVQLAVESMGLACGGLKERGTRRVADPRWGVPSGPVCRCMACKARMQL